FLLTSTGEPAASEVFCRLDGLPLAIELAAARTTLPGLEELLARLTRSLDVFGEGPRDLPARQRTLPARLAWSYELRGVDEDNLHAALDSLLASGDVEQALRTGNALMRYWRARGHAVEARRWLDAALDRADEVDPHVRAGALWTAGRLAMAQSDLGPAERR